MSNGHSGHNFWQQHMFVCARVWGKFILAIFNPNSTKLSGAHHKIHKIHKMFFDEDTDIYACCDDDFKLKLTVFVHCKYSLAWLFVWLQV